MDILSFSFELERLTYCMIMPIEISDSLSSPIASYFSLENVFNTAIEMNIKCYITNAEK